MTYSKLIAEVEALKHSDVPHLHPTRKAWNDAVCECLAIIRQHEAQDLCEMRTALAAHFADSVADEYEAADSVLNALQPFLSTPQPSQKDTLP